MMIPYSRQSVNEADIQAVVDVLRSDFLTQGACVPAFEKAVCDYTGARHAVAVNSCTSALHISCLALGLAEGDRLWTTAITFVASANCGLYCGATVEFVDIDPDTWNISVDKLQEKLRWAKLNQCLPKIVVVVHLCGLPCGMQAIAALADEYGFKIIEDACHAMGARYQGMPVGSCRYSAITVFSFHPVKPITTGEGGMAMTNDADLARKMALYRSHGITREPGLMTKAPDGPWYYEQQVLGFNHRLTDIQAALGLSQLKRLDSFISARNVLAVRYQRLLAGLPVKMQVVPQDCYSGYHLFVIRLQPNSASNSHLAVFKALREQGVGVNLHYMPVYRQPYYQSINSAWPVCQEAERYYAEAISLPLFPALQEGDQEFVVASLNELLLG